jgi:hypothetical protein
MNDELPIKCGEVIVYRFALRVIFQAFETLPEFKKIDGR